MHITEHCQETFAAGEMAQETTLKVTAHSNNRNSKSSREVILGSVRLWQSVILRNYDMFSTDSNARYSARW